MQFQHDAEYDVSAFEPDRYYYFNHIVCRNYDDELETEDYQFDGIIESGKVLKVLGEAKQSIILYLHHQNVMNQIHFNFHNMQPPILVEEPSIDERFSIRHRKNYAYHNMYFEMNPEIKQLFEKIISYYHNTEQDKQFNIVSECINGTECVSFGTHGILEYQYRITLFGKQFSYDYTTNKYIRHKVYTFMSSDLAKYFEFDLTAFVTFKNDHTSDKKSDYVPHFTPHKANIKLNPNIIDPALITQIEFNALEYFETNKYIQDIINEVEAPYPTYPDELNRPDVEITEQTLD